MLTRDVECRTKQVFFTSYTMLFNNLLAAAALASTAFAAPAENRQSSNRKMKWFGINESGAEFGEKNFTGVYGKEFTWYDLNTIDKFMAEGMNMFRLNFCKSLYVHILRSGLSKNTN